MIVGHCVFLPATASNSTERVKELQPEVSNRALADTLGGHHDNFIPARDKVGFPADHPSRCRLHASIPAYLSAGCEPQVCSKLAWMISHPNRRKPPNFRLPLRQAPSQTSRRASRRQAVDDEDQQPFDIDDLRAWWKRGLGQGRTENPSRDRKRIEAAGALVGVVLVGLVFELKVGAPRELPVMPLVKDIASITKPSGEIARTFADVGTMPPTGLSGVVPVGPAVDTQAVQSLATKPSAKTVVPVSARRPDGFRSRLSSLPLRGR